MKTIVKKIKAYNRIIIHRHTRPDLDALGSQIGLKEAIKATFSNKEVYIVGDINSSFSFMGNMDTVTDDLYKDALVIITDVAVSHLISDERYKKGKEVIVIDHHTNKADIDAYTYIKSDISSASEVVADIIRRSGFKLTIKGATALFGGMVTDTGRFLYSGVNENTFYIAGYLLENGADTKFIYQNLYVESLESKKMKAYFQSHFQVTDDGVGYLINKKEIYDQFDVDTFTISRGMVNVMAGIDIIKIWANFTFDRESEKVLCEIRSRGIKVVDVAKKYGGGGHDEACGCTLDSFLDANKVLDDLNELSRRFNDGTNIK